MKATQKDFAAVAARAAREARVFFLCGQDEAGIQDGAARIVALLDDPGERIEFAGADLRRDPVRLGDEARSTSLFGGARHIVVRASGDEAAEALANLLDGQGEACPVIVLATNATDKSKTAKLLADRPDALVVTFWPPDLKSVAGAVRTMADAAGVRIDGAMAERIARAAGLDTRIARSEIAKLALYLDAGPEAPKSADAAAFEAIGASTEEDGFMPLVNAVLGGEAGRIPGELRRMRELGLNPVAVVLALERRAAQLAALASKLGPRGDVRQVIEAEKAARRIFWKDERDLTQQLKRWRGRRLERLVARTATLHRQLLANSQSAELFLAQGLAEIGRVAAAKG
ncbi:DNA polymerase III subunit delta [Novosphingobium sp.]|uniref:DNA polymerase III subunit delta n=1 Tax=Novosphingobium sp. TaxID=1874826 RepID=UPI00263625C6|nr:DNA polymerase III subunit delta [Novosphingobium sp.]